MKGMLAKLREFRTMDGDCLARYAVVITCAGLALMVVVAFWRSSQF